MNLSEEFAQLLAELGLGTYPGSIFLTRMPTGPDRCLVVARYGGPESSLADDYDEPSIQIRARGPAADARVAEEDAQDVYDALNGLDRRYLAGGTWLQLMVATQGGPIFIGQDQNGRVEFTVNLRAEVRMYKPSTNRSRT
ncbi:minor capsid protein [Streptosporangium sp. NPDC051022]|uniref:minor capsid protein n=1 Tax=Streptosporangium sp. NPDC051022 TaxID=3155752 RepID=UPI00342E5BB8